jgi:hypothetical protein
MKRILLILSLVTLMVTANAQINAKHLLGTIYTNDLRGGDDGSKALTTSVFLRMAVAETAYEIPLKKGSTGQYFSATGIGGSLAFYKLENEVAVEKYTVNLLFFTPNVDPSLVNISTALTVGVPIPNINLPILNAGIRYAWKEKIAYFQTGITLEF